MDQGFGKLNRRKFLLGLAGLGLVSWRLPEAHAFQPFDPIKIAYITDVHLANGIPDSYLMIQESQLFLQQLVKELNEEKVDFVVFGGDNVHTVGKDAANWQLFIECLNPLNAPWNFVLGERDVSGDYPVDKLRTYGADWRDNGVKTDLSYWSMNLECAPNIHFIGLDTSIPNTTVGGMSQRQLNWLKADLEDNKRFFTVIFAHHPLLPPPPFDSGPPWDDYVIPDSGSAREVIGAYPNVKMVVSGHLHVSKVQAERDVWHVSSPSLACWPCAYRIFTLAPDTVTMETRQIQFPALIKKARKALIGSGLADKYSRTNPESFLEVAEGTREDQDALIPMRGGRTLQPYNPKKTRKAAPKPEAGGEQRHRWGRKKQQETPQPEDSKTGAAKHRQHSKPTSEPASETVAPKPTEEVVPKAEQIAPMPEPKSLDTLLKETAPTPAEAPKE